MANVMADLGLVFVASVAEHFLAAESVEGLAGGLCPRPAECPFGRRPTALGAACTSAAHLPAPALIAWCNHGGAILAWCNHCQ